MPGDEYLGGAVLVLETDARKFIDELKVAKDQAKGAQDTFNRVHGDLQNKFSQKFEHIGIKTFGHEMLNAAGITSGTRPIISAMSLAVTSLDDAFGFASGPIGLLVFGLGALAAIGYKVYDSHKKSAETLAELTKKQNDALQTTSELSARLNELATSGILLTPAMKRLASVTEELHLAQLRNSQHLAGERRSAIVGELNSAEAMALGYKKLASSYEVLMNTSLPLSRRWKDASERMNLFNRAADEAEKSVLKLRQEQAQLTVTAEAQTGAHEKLILNIEKLSRAHPALTEVEAKYAAEARNSADSTYTLTSAISAMFDEVNTSAMFANEEMDRFLSGLKEKSQGQISETKQIETAMKSMAVTTSRSIGAMTASWLNGSATIGQMADRIVFAIIEVIFQMAILDAFGGGIAGAFAGGLVGGISGGRADGGPVSAGRTYMVGERGPELFTPSTSGLITPNGGGGSIVVEVNNTVSGADFASPETLSRIFRGMATAARQGVSEALDFSGVVADAAALNSSRARA